VVYLEWLAAVVLMLNTVYHLGHYLRRSFYLDPVFLSPTQKKLMGISDSGIIVILENKSNCGEPFNYHSQFYQIVFFCKSNSMEQTVSWEINSYSSDQEISYFSWNLKVYY
jgi:hypothetical protein